MKIKHSFKQSEIGLVPESWNVASFGSLVTDFRGGAPLKPSDFKQSGIKVLPKGGVGRRGWLTINNADIQYCSQEYAAKYSHNQVDNSFTIIVLRDLVPSGPSIGLIVNIREPETYVLAQGVYGFKLIESAVSGYLVHLSNTQWYRKLLNSIMVGSTQVHVTNTALKRALIPIPPKEEQIAISNALNDASSLVESLEKLIEKKHQIKQGAMQELLTGKKRLQGYNGEWEEKSLGDIAIALKGSGLSKSKLNDFGANSCILYGELFTTYGREIKNVVSKTNSLDGVESVDGDVLVPASTTTSGIDLATASAINKRGVKLGGDINIIRKKHEASFDSIFLSYYLTNSMRTEIAEKAQGSTIIHLYGRDLLKLKIKIPKDLTEQTAIAEVLTNLDAELTKWDLKLSKARQIKQGMMQELLTGRIRLV